MVVCKCRKFFWNICHTCLKIHLETKTVNALDYHDYHVNETRDFGTLWNDSVSRSLICQLASSNIKADLGRIAKSNLATKLYCFVHKVPVCGECICFPEHRICIIRTYSEWVIDGEYDWPPKCCKCMAVLDEGTGSETTRLGCLHVTHTDCLASHIKSFPLHTAPAGYVCPSCATPIWPPKSIKDSGSQLHSNLREAIMNSGTEKNLFGNYPVSIPTAELRAPPPPAFASDPLVNLSPNGGLEYGPSSSASMATDGMSTGEGYTVAIAGPSKLTVSEIMEIDSPRSAGNYMKSSSPPHVATTRKGTTHIERQSSEISYYADDEDGNHKKYSRRGSLRHKFLRALLPFWSSALPTLPVTAPPRKDASNSDDVLEGRSRQQRPRRMDPRKILLVIAIMACMATMGILYYRLAQRALGDGFADEEHVEQ